MAHKLATTHTQNCQTVKKNPTLEWSGEFFFHTLRWW